MIPAVRTLPINKVRGRPKKSMVDMKESRQMENVFNRGICACGVSVREDGSSAFRCVHCNYHFHWECMLRKEEERSSCLPCHLERALPDRQVLKTLFIGYLHKDKKKHFCSFFLKPSEMPAHARVQIRCFRLKEGCQNIMQFPDSATLTLQRSVVKEFTPLHRQSSLKHRKDESVFIENVLLSKKENKLVVTERENNSRDERVESYSHVLGVYLTEERKVEELLQEVVGSGRTTFQ